MRILVCGGRDYADRHRVYRALDIVHAKHGITLIIEGRCPYGGADRLAQDWAEDRGIANAGFPMDRSLGRRAGPIRNSQMLTEGKPDAGVAFPGDRGTADMVKKMVKAGLPVWQVPA